MTLDGVRSEALAAAVSGSADRFRYLKCGDSLRALFETQSGNEKGIDRELRANVLPGVTIVPAMVIAIEQAQAAGIRYNRQ
jgi:hypothetical protein